MDRVMGKISDLTKESQKKLIKQFSEWHMTIDENYDLDTSYGPLFDRPDNRTTFSFTYLAYAVKVGDVKLVGDLLENGADPNLIDQIGFRTPLELAADFGRAECAQLLLAHGAENKQVTSLFYTPDSFQGFSNPLTFLWSLKQKVQNKDVDYEKTQNLISQGPKH